MTALREPPLSALGEMLQAYRTDRPHEWAMDEFTRHAEKLHQQNSKLTADNAALVEALEGCVCDLMNRDGEMPSTATGWAAEAIEALKQAKGDV